METSAVLIICMQLIIVPLAVLRTTFTVKGKTSLASIIGGIESLIYVISLSVVFSDLSNHTNMIAYAIGFAGGVFLGGRLEKALAIGYRTFNISITKKDETLIEMLRLNGFGVTVFEGIGIDNETRYRLDVMVKRNREKEIMQLVKKYAPGAFIVAYEPTVCRGGYVQGMKKQTFKEWLSFK